MAAFSTALTVGATVGGLGLSGYGLSQSMAGSEAYASAQAEAIRIEQLIEAQRKRAMELDAKRKNIELVRTQQRARSIALTAATAQNAQLGSGLQGGYGQIGGQVGFEQLGILQNLDIGRRIFGLNAALSEQKIAMGNAQSQMYTGQGMMSLGGSLMNSAGTLGKIGQGFGNPFATPVGTGQFGSFGRSTFNPTRMGSLY